MAKATTSTFGNFKLLIGDGATPTEAFAAICGLTSKGINFSSDTTDVEVPDCTDEDLPAYKEKGIKAQEITLTGSGMWAAEHHGDMINWWKSGIAKNAKVQYVDAVNGDPEFINGPLLLISIGNTVEKGGRLSAELSFAFASMPTFVDAA